MARNLWIRRLIAWLGLPLILLGAVAAWLVLDPAFRREHQITNFAAEAPRDDFERRVHDYLMAHPEVIMQSVTQFEARQRANEETEVRAIVSATDIDTLKAMIRVAREHRQ